MTSKGYLIYVLILNLNNENLKNFFLKEYYLSNSNIYVLGY
jgi:Zn-dependent M16 (insulinase) family peptidase